MEVQKNRFSLIECLHNVTSIAKFKSEAVSKMGSHTTITLNTANLPDIVVGDEMRLTQVLINLITNGLKFCNESPVISVDASLVSSTDSDFELKFSVTDNGIGIKAEHYPLL